jgi:hypothetical protein
MAEPFKIGKIAQVAFVVRDLEARMQAFWEDFGIGPWAVYAFEPPRVKDMTYRGERQDFRMRVAFAMCGETQIELVQSGRGYGVRGDGAFAYFATVDRLSTLIELIQLPQQRYPPDATYPPA